MPDFEVTTTIMLSSVISKSNAKWTLVRNMEVASCFLKEKNCLRDIFLLSSRKKNCHKNFTGSQFAKLNPREKNFFFRFSELAKLTFLH